jgi:hypothetical protein
MIYLLKMNWWNLYSILFYSMTLHFMSDTWIAESPYLCLSAVIECEGLCKDSRPRCFDDVSQSEVE